MNETDPEPICCICEEHSDLLSKEWLCPECSDKQRVAADSLTNTSTTADMTLDSLRETLHKLSVPVEHPVIYVRSVGEFVSWAGASRCGPGSFFSGIEIVPRPLAIPDGYVGLLGWHKGNVNAPHRIELLGKTND